MRPVGANREVELKEELVPRDAFEIVDEAVLAAYLAEFAGPERQEDRSARVDRAGVEGAPGPIDTAADVPAARELVFTQCVEAERPLRRVDLGVLPAPDQFGSQIETAVDRPSQRPVPEGGVE